VPVKTGSHGSVMIYSDRYWHSFFSIYQCSASFLAVNLSLTTPR